MAERTPATDSRRNDPWPEAAQQLARLAAQRGKQFGSAEQLQQLDAVCATISALCDTDPSPAAVEIHKLLQLLATVLSKVLDQGNHRKWRQAAYAARVCSLMQALHGLVCMAGIGPGSGVMAQSVVATRVSSQLSDSGLLPKLAVAVQEVAAVLSAASRRPDAAATAGSSQFDQQQSGGAQLPATMLLLLVDVLKCWPGGVLGSAAAAPLAAPTAQLVHAAVSTIQQRWEASNGGQQQQQLQQQVAVQQDLRACVIMSYLLMRLLHVADWEKMDQQPHSLQLLRAPQYHQLLLLLLAVGAQQLPEQTAGNSARSASTGTSSSLHAASIAGSAGTSSSSSSSGTSSSSGSSGTSSGSGSGSGQQPMQQQLASGITAAGQKQQLPYQLQLWQSLGLPQQLLGVACGALSLSLYKPCEDFHATCSVLNYCLEDLVTANPGRFVSHDELSPSQMAVARLHQPVPMLLLETAAAFISNTSLVMNCANAAARSLNCWRLVLDEQLASKTDVKGQSGAAIQGASTAAAQLPVRELQQLVLQLFKQVMQQPEAAGIPCSGFKQQQQQAKAASSSSQRIEQQQQPGGSADMTHALTALMRVLRSLLCLPLELHLSWQGYSAVLQTFVRNLLSCSSSKDVETIKQGAAVQVAAIAYNQVVDSLCIQYGSQEPGQLVRAAAEAAAGGAEQLQLFGLLLSTIKLWHSHMLHIMGARGEEVLPSAKSVRYIHNLGLAAHHMLAGLAPAAGSSAAGVGVVQPAAVPWLVLQARCLYLAGALLHKQAAWKPAGGPDDPGLLGKTNAVYAAERVILGAHACVAGAAEVAIRLATYLHSCCCPAPAAESNSSEQAGNAGTCTAAASSSSDSRQQADLPAAQAGVLTAPSAATPAAATPVEPGTVGCELQQELLSLAESLLQAVSLAETTGAGLTAMTQQPGAHVLDLLQQGSGRLEILSGQFTAIGAALCVQLPTPHCCNAPGCTNMAMASEQQLVGGKSCICAGCQVARYCGKECQTAHWKQHRPVCRRIRKQQLLDLGL